MGSPSEGAAVGARRRVSRGARSLRAGYVGAQIDVCDLQGAVATALDSSSRGYEAALRQAEAREAWLEERCR